jgi:hypothetical protein
LSKSTLENGKHASNGKDTSSREQGLIKEVELLREHLGSFLRQLKSTPPPPPVPTNLALINTNIANSTIQKNLPNKKVKLSIGGQLFTTSIQTLLKERSMLSAMFSGQFNLEPDEDGSYFIDRDPKHFATILNYLRTGMLILKEDQSSAELKEFRLEAEFYQVEGLLKQLEKKYPKDTPLRWDAKLKSDKIVLSEGNRVATRTNGSGWDAAFLGNKPNTSYRVRCYNSTTLNVGMAPITFEPNASNFLSCGWYLNLYCGNLFSMQDEVSHSYCDKMIEPGKIIEVNYNPKMKQIRFIIDGIDYGVAFKGVEGTVYPCIELGEAGSRVELIDMPTDEEL